ANDDNYALAA
ncbi:tmRNA tag peptide, partial [Pseudomonas aeruginosa]